MDTGAGLSDDTGRPEAFTKSLELQICLCTLQGVCIIELHRRCQNSVTSVSCVYYGIQEKTQPLDPDVAIEIPSVVKRHFGLDSQTSWIVLDDFNTFTWPGYDLRPIPNRDGRYDYGLLPPKFFDRIVGKFTELRQAGKIAHASRDDETKK